MRHAGVVEDEVLRELRDREGDRVTDGDARLEVQRGEAAIDGRVVVLDAGWDAEEPPRPEPRGASVRVVIEMPVRRKCSRAR